MRAPLVLLVIAACGGERSSPPPIRFLHTFAPEETELLNALVVEQGLAVDASLVPFARGQQVTSEILRSGTTCPDLIRIDATWLPGLVAGRLLRPVPAAAAQLDWLPEAAALATVDGVLAALPAAIDGLVVVRDGSTPAPRDPTIDALVAAARAATGPGRAHPLGVRLDAYWLVPWLRAHGADLAVDRIDDRGAADAIGAFAALFGDVVPPPPAAGIEARDELRRWTAHELAYWLTGPWQLGALGDRERLAVSALAGAPRGGQLLVVPACAARAEDGWRLATVLTGVDVQRRFADAFATVPTRASALAAAPALARAIHAALAVAEPLPRSPLTPLLFDDLNPALAAAVHRDATPEEAISGVRHGWQRLAAQGQRP